MTMQQPTMLSKEQVEKVLDKICETVNLTREQLDQRTNGSVMLFMSDNRKMGYVLNTNERCRFEVGEAVVPVRTYPFQYRDENGNDQSLEEIGFEQEVGMYLKRYVPPPEPQTEVEKAAEEQAPVQSSPVITDSAKELSKILNIVSECYLENPEAFKDKFRGFYKDVKVHLKIHSLTDDKSERSQLYQALSLFDKCCNNSSYEDAYKQASIHWKVPETKLRSVVASRNRNKRSPV